MSLIDDLNSLTDKMLGGIDDLGNPEEFLGQTPGNKPAMLGDLHYVDRNNILAAVETLKRTVRPGQYEALAKLAWRCLKCNTVNGLQISSKTVVRKTCKKCAHPRKNKLTVLQEFRDLNRQVLVKDMMKANPKLELEEANRMFDELNEVDYDDNPTVD